LTRFRSGRSGDQPLVTEQDPKQAKADEAREKAGEQSMRPDIQAGALELAEGDEPRKHEHPSYRETAQERDKG
jgi:hypothetical protein